MEEEAHAGAPRGNDAAQAAAQTRSSSGHVRVFVRAVGVKVGVKEALIVSVQLCVVVAW